MLELGNAGGEFCGILENLSTFVHMLLYAGRHFRVGDLLTCFNGLGYSKTMKGLVVQPARWL